MVGLGEGKIIEPEMMVELIKENCGMYAADDDESHTAEGYMKELNEALPLVGMGMAAATGAMMANNNK